MSTSTKIHPKMRMRYAQVKREAGQRRLRFLTTSLILLSIVIITTLVLLSPLLDIDRLLVKGGGGYATKIRSAAGISLGDPLIKVRAKEIAKRVMAVPEISRAKVDVHWPHEVVITVTTRKPLLYVKHNDKFVPLAKDGIVLSTIRDSGDGVVIIEGARDVPNPGEKVNGDLRAAVQFVAGLDNATKVKIGPLVINEKGQLTTTVVWGKGKLTVLLGDTTDMDAKSVALQTLLQDQVASQSIRLGKIIDLRSARSPIVSDPNFTTSTTLNSGFVTP